MPRYAIEMPRELILGITWERNDKIQTKGTRLTRPGFSFPLNWFQDDACLTLSRSLSVAAFSATLAAFLTSNDISSDQRAATGSNQVPKTSLTGKKFFVWPKAICK